MGCRNILRVKRKRETFRPIIKIKPPIWFAFSSVFFVVTMSIRNNMITLSRLEYE